LFSPVSPQLNALSCYEKYLASSRCPRYNYVEVVFSAKKAASMKGRMKIHGFGRLTTKWLLAIVIVVSLSVVLLLCGQSGLPAAARAQPQPPENGLASLYGGRSGQILVIPIQLDRSSYGLAMVDTVGQTLWVYQLNNTGPVYNRLQLLAARSWRYDRLLQQYNTADPKPQQVKMLLEGFAAREEPESQNKQDLNQPVFQTAEPNSSESNGNR